MDCNMVPIVGYVVVGWSEVMVGKVGRACLVVWYICIVYRLAYNILRVIIVWVVVLVIGSVSLNCGYRRSSFCVFGVLGLPSSWVCHLATSARCFNTSSVATWAISPKKSCLYPLAYCSCKE
ncbi:uncharacterized protein G2W53_000793 [Senna tora]|uniref:Uncharacterized protein n=1 Tax=Senna tora TaxID=362788 RepID=A0A834XG29_9FABA|nr:uncharacterized protein G2W53_000793 [Senna tora]